MYLPQWLCIPSSLQLQLHAIQIGYYYFFSLCNDWKLYLQTIHPSWASYVSLHFYFVCFYCSLLNRGNVSLFFDFLVHLSQRRGWIDLNSSHPTLISNLCNLTYYYYYILFISYIYKAHCSLAFFWGILMLSLLWVRYTSLIFETSWVFINVLN